MVIREGGRRGGGNWEPRSSKIATVIAPRPPCTSQYKLASDSSIHWPHFIDQETVHAGGYLLEGSGGRTELQPQSSKFKDSFFNCELGWGILCPTEFGPYEVQADAWGKIHQPNSPFLEGRRGKCSLPKCEFALKLLINGMGIDLIGHQ